MALSFLFSDFVGAGIEEGDPILRLHVCVLLVRQVLMLHLHHRHVPGGPDNRFLLGALPPVAAAHRYYHQGGDATAQHWGRNAVYEAAIFIHPMS